MQAETKQCQNCQNSFMIEPEDFVFYDKIHVPAPTFCPECRMQRRFIWRNERALYSRKDELGKDVISVFAPDSPYKIYNRDYWWSDNWDARDYGLELDFTKPFFTQFNELLHSVPLVSIFNTNTVNSPYTNHVTDLKSCYLCFACAFCENTAYSDRSGVGRDSYDISVSDECELCYSVVDCEGSYKLAFSQNSIKCVNSMFLFDCRNCQDCFGCVGLRNKQYHIYNKPYSREEYFQLHNALNLTSWSGLQKVKEDFEKFSLTFPRKFARLTNAVNSSGDNLSNVKNCNHCFDKRRGVEDCKYLIHAGFGEKSTYDTYGTGVAEWLYEAVDSGMSGAMCRFSVVGYGLNDVHYVYNCHSSSYLFGCIGIRNKQYCILNKQYSKEEYLELLPKVIAHMNDMPYIDALGREYKYGEFFPSELSPFAYNETIAHEHLPMTKEKVLANGFRWRNPEPKKYHPTICADDLPDSIKDVNDGLLKEVIGCQHKESCNHQCTMAFKLLPAELEYYRNMNFPLPRLCSNCRYYERLAKRNPAKLWHRKCMKPGCENEFETSYAPDRPDLPASRQETVYCEKCYNAEVV